MPASCGRPEASTRHTDSSTRSVARSFDGSTAAAAAATTAAAAGAGAGLGAAVAAFALGTGTAAAAAAGVLTAALGAAIHATSTDSYGKSTVVSAPSPPSSRHRTRSVCFCVSTATTVPAHTEVRDVLTSTDQPTATGSGGRASLDKAHSGGSIHAMSLDA